MRSSRRCGRNSRLAASDAQRASLGTVGDAGLMQHFALRGLSAGGRLDADRVLKLVDFDRVGLRVSNRPVLLLLLQSGHATLRTIMRKMSTTRLCRTIAYLCAPLENAGK
jgi:hypothetical protein